MNHYAMALLYALLFSVINRKTHRAEIWVFCYVLSDIVVLCRKCHDQQKRIPCLLPDAALFVHVWNQQRKHDKFRWSVIRASVEQQLQDLGFSRETNSELVEHLYQLRLDRCVPVLLTVTWHQQLEQRSNDRFVNEQHLLRLTDKEFVHFKGVKFETGGVLRGLFIPLVEFLEDIVCEWVVEDRTVPPVFGVLFYEQQHHLVNVVHYGLDVLLFCPPLTRSRRCFTHDCDRLLPVVLIYHQTCCRVCRRLRRELHHSAVLCWCFVRRHVWWRWRRFLWLHFTKWRRSLKPTHVVFRWLLFLMLCLSYFSCIFTGQW